MIIALYALLNRPLGEVDKFILHVMWHLRVKGRQVCVCGGGDRERQRQGETGRQTLESDKHRFTPGLRLDLNL